MLERHQLSPQPPCHGTVNECCFLGIRINPLRRLRGAIKGGSPCRAMKFKHHSVRMASVFVARRVSKPSLR